MTNTIDKTTEANICQPGGSEASLMGITTGLVRGIIEDQTDRLLSGACADEIPI